MADRRMISKGLSISKKFNIAIEDHFTRMLYMMMLPHTDDFGRMDGCPRKVRALVIPMLDESWKVVEKAIGELAAAELIEWYESDGDQYIQFNNFDKYQTGLHKRTKSKFPEPPGNSEKFREVPGSSEEVPGSSRNDQEIHGQQNLIELNLTEQNLTEEKKDIGDADAPTKPKRFVKPTLEEVKAYCEERNRGVNPVKWFNHYEAKGWKIGKTVMKDWKAAVRTWEEEDNGKHGRSNQESVSDPYARYDFGF